MTTPVQIQRPPGLTLADVVSATREQAPAWLAGDSFGGFVTWAPSRAFVGDGPWIEAVREFTADAPLPGPVPFAGGLVGVLGYRAGRHVERMPELPPGPTADAILRRYDGAVYAKPDRWVVVGRPAWVDAAREVLGSLQPSPERPGQGRLVDLGDPEAYAAAAWRVIDHLRAGDCYQVNLARRLVARGTWDPVHTFRRLRETPTPWAALVALPDGAWLVGDSPEGFLVVDGRDVTSHPMKGTRPRARDGVGDEAVARELRDDPKEQAELTMIVDLVRNDLSRVCEPGTVVWAPRELLLTPTVHQAQQAVRGRLAHGRTLADLMAATLPVGSVTGAPKVRACELIAALEPTPRGLYCGITGWAGGQGARWCVNIRTATFLPDPHGSTVHIPVGAGLVIGSRPQRELAETGWKARSLLAALDLDHGVA